MVRYLGRRSFVWLSMFLLVSLVCVDAGTASAQAPRVVYVYDDLGRLVEVIDLGTGQCAVYAYDAVGNVLSITRRTDCAAPPTVGSISPGPEPNSFTVTGTNLLGATISLSDPAFRITDLRVTGNTLTFRVSSPEPICAFLVTATVTTSFGSVQLPIAVTGVLLTGDGQPVRASLDVPGQKDQFCFTLPATERVLVEATGTGGSLFPCLELRTSTGAPVPNAQGCFSPIRLDVTLAPGTYGAVVSDFLGHTGTYNVTLTRFVGGRTLLPEVPIEDALSALGAIDRYTFTVPATEQILLEVFRTGDGVFPCLELRTAAGTPLVDAQNCGTRLDVGVTPGTYFALVKDAGNDGAGPYRVTLTRFVGGRPLIPDVPMVDALSPPGDVDLYTFALTSSERVLIEAVRTTQSGSIRPCLDLRTAAGVPVAIGQRCGNPVSLDLTLPAGSYLVAVSDEEHNDTGGYSVLLTRFVGARLMVVGVPAVDALDPLGDVDVYTFTLAASRRVLLNLSRTSGLIHPCLDLRTAAGVPVANGQVCGTSTGLDLTLAAGTYFVKVADEFRNEIGGYNVLLQTP